jgi:cell division septal protein FtsQ
LERAADFSPLTYMETATAIENGLNLTWFGVFLVINLVLALISWQLFQRRDVRVGGEGTLRLKDLATGKWKAKPVESLAEIESSAAD